MYKALIKGFRIVRNQRIPYRLCSEDSVSFVFRGFHIACAKSKGFRIVCVQRIQYRLWTEDSASYATCDFESFEIKIMRRRIRELPFETYDSESSVACDPESSVTCDLNIWFPIVCNMRFRIVCNMWSGIVCLQRIRNRILEQTIGNRLFSASHLACRCAHTIRNRTFVRDTSC